MSSYSFGKSAEQSALELLVALSNPAEFQARVKNLKDEREQVDIRTATAVAAEKSAEKKINDAEKATAEAKRLNIATEDKRAEIADRQGNWELNLNVREAAVKKAEADHGDQVSKFEVYKTQKENELAGRIATLTRREQEHEKRRQELDRRQAQLEEQAKAAADLAKLLGR